MAPPLRLGLLVGPVEGAAEVLGIGKVSIVLVAAHVGMPALAVPEAEPAVAAYAGDDGECGGQAGRVFM